MCYHARLPNRCQQNLQRVLAEHLRALAHPNVYWFHLANGGTRSAIEGAILKTCGVHAGTPDLILVRDGKTFALELKSAGGRLSPAQQEAREELRRAGAKVAIVVSIDDAISHVARWQLFQGPAQ